MIAIQPICRCPSMSSARYVFQWKYVLSAVPPVLNVGCADDPVRLGEYAVHFDYDDWGTLYAQRGQKFVQGDAHHLPFADGEFDLVICGDVLEHAVNPTRMFLECCRVARRWAVCTIFEEWRLPGTGQHIEAGTAHRDWSARQLGFDSADAQYAAEYKECKIKNGISHLPHVNQFTDADILTLVGAILGLAGLGVSWMNIADIM